MPGRLILWDIDGTLVRAGQIAADVFATAVEHAVGRHPGEHGVRMGGKTDPQIALEILASMGIETGHDHLPLVLGRLEADLAGAVDLMREVGTVLPGVREVLARLDAEPGVTQTVLTGNTAAKAATKLAAFDLDRWLDLEIGAFGSDNADRLQLVPVALQRTAERRGRHFDVEDVWVVGDTVHDLACARAAGARCALVRTGARPAELDSVDADAVLDDLSDVDSVVKLLATSDR
ncbi:MAG TPA: haloacid dehalogenase-like hydrolase [Acidimicrobiales bacterium]|jgi:phosphoglycolate phosphatase-like HAD superfamily hydrolase